VHQGECGNGGKAKIKRVKGTRKSGRGGGMNFFRGKRGTEGRVVVEWGNKGLGRMGRESDRNRRVQDGTNECDNNYAGSYRQLKELKRKQGIGSVGTKESCTRCEARDKGGGECDLT